MSAFEFIFSFFGLLLGLALADGLGGLSRALKASHKVRIGWATILLAVFVSCDVVSFWMYGWGLRDALQLNWPVLFCGFLVTATYYVAASLIFPDDPEEWGDLDRYFDKYHRKVLGGIMLCNVALMATIIGLAGTKGMFTFRFFVLSWSFFPVSLIAIIAKDRRIVIGCLIWLILLYPLTAIWH